MDKFWDMALGFPCLSTFFFLSLLGLLLKLYYITGRFRKNSQPVDKIDDLTWTLSMICSVSGPIKKTTKFNLIDILLALLGVLSQLLGALAILRYLIESAVILSIFYGLYFILGTLLSLRQYIIFIKESAAQES
jgi:hypothetical protein